ncbi:MAG: SMI1/KNR4 family protein [Deltaproteobacteria bacterium]
MAAAKKPKKMRPPARQKSAPKRSKPQPRAKTATGAKANAKAKAKTKPKAAKPRAKPAKATPKATPKAKSKAIKARTKAEAIPAAELDAVPRIIDDDELFSNSGRRKTARDWSARSSPVVEILDDPHPVGALRRFLDSIKGPATEQQSEIALGAAQLLLLPIARESRGGGEVKELLDLVLERWADFGDRRFGFHAQEFLRNAFAAVGVDRDRITRLEAAVPAGATGELLFEIACAHAVARDKVAMLRSVEEALAAGATPSQFRREHDFAPYVADPSLAVILARADIPAIPVDVDPYRVPVRDALDSLVGVLKELGGQVELRPPARLDTILDAERAAKLSLPNDYRAFLSITNGMRLLDREFLATADYRDPTALAQRAHHFVHAEYAMNGLSDCVPLASWGTADDWLLYDPRGRVRGGAPGYIATLGKDEIILDDLVAALMWLEELTRDILGTN